MRKDCEVRGLVVFLRLWFLDGGSGGSSSSMASRVGLRCGETVRWRMDGVRAPEMGKRVGVAGEVHFIAVRTGADTKRL
jgi:hypothetical protein